MHDSPGSITIWDARSVDTRILFPCNCETRYAVMNLVKIHSFLREHERVNTWKQNLSWIAYNLLLIPQEINLYFYYTVCQAWKYNLLKRRPN